MTKQKMVYVVHNSAGIASVYTKIEDARKDAKFLGAHTTLVPLRTSALVNLDYLQTNIVQEDRRKVNDVQRKK
ncbi:hypothetical protein [Liquorilactobacillus hordei]|uniref:Uncharacterized protein n=1 Tax=Liquorilactobacillus hordei DSM 19519 TaxID=1423759 RepID=A0A0R1MQG3_9LACO|nr:hypothetical protein [Liquorilactobacillus hordei]KRL07972.1 hypothetical protein FC92_GL001041 [Liquorilactobacillus hordei DSM 19519]QYH51084.1 hypothetical protein G6O70_00550 [Liquorilactobacillus hordei DSM 19519]